MPSYVETLDVNQKKAIELMVKSMVKRGITNKFMQGAIMAVVSKESNFRPKSEGGYGGTSNERIRKIFGSRVSELSEAELNTLKADNEAFFNKVYGGRYGNAANEGYKYRGRGLNQITFKGNYQAMSQYTDADIVGNPDLLNTLEVAVDVCVGYFLRNFNSSRNKLGEYNMADLNDAKNAEDACGAAYHANAGWGKDKADLERRASNGRTRAFARVNELVAVAEAVDTTGVIPEETGNSGGASAGFWTTKDTNLSGGISASVGTVGRNKSADVRVVQTLLNNKISAGLVVDGYCGNKTITAIKKFQSEQVGMSNPDGRIDVGGRTWQALSSGSTTPTETAPGSGTGSETTVEIVPTSLDAAVFPCFN